MIRALGHDVDTYYGTNDTLSDVQLLWNASSSLAHGETWFGQFSGGRRPRRLGALLTSRSFDAVCSGISTVSMRVVELAMNPVEPTASPSPTLASATKRGGRVRPAGTTVHPVHPLLPLTARL